MSWRWPIKASRNAKLGNYLANIKYLQSSGDGELFGRRSAASCPRESAGNPCRERLRRAHPDT